MFKRFWWVFLVMIPLGALCGLLIAAVVTYVMPKKYESEAVLEVKVLHPNSSVFMTPQFFGNEFEKIKSRKSLGEVADQLGLAEKWGLDRESTIRVLKSIIATNNIRGTDLIAIRVRHSNREDTRDIASAVAQVYQKQRAEAFQEISQRALAEINEEVDTQEKKLEERRIELAEQIQSSSEVAEVKRHFETDQAHLHTLKLKQIGISMESAGESVILHEEPQTPQIPVSPNVTLNLILGTTLGLLLSPLMALPVILLLGRFVPRTGSRTE
jgi:capsular polysaccharide biosynthesis protein